MEQVNHSERAHARLAPSSMERIVACPGSVGMSKDAPENGATFFTQEGTAAHQLNEHCWGADIDPWDLVGWFVDLTPGAKQLIAEDLEADDFFIFRIDEEMADGTELYLSTLREYQARGAEIEVEQRLDMSHIHPDCWGTGDATAFVEAENLLVVCDYKYGRSKAVDAHRNPQLLTYALGAYRRYHNRKIDRILLCIVQPRAPIGGKYVRYYDLAWDELDVFEHDLRNVLATVDNEDVVLNAGSHCAWCPALLECPAHSKMITDILRPLSGDLGTKMELPEIMSLSIEQLGVILENATKINAFVRAGQKRIHDEAMSGTKIPGVKLVAKRGRRVFTDADAVKAVLDVEGYDHTYWTATKMLTVAQLEKKLGKKQQGIISEFIHKVSSGLTLAPVDDPRPEVKREGHFGAAEDADEMEK